RAGVGVVFEVLGVGVGGDVVVAGTVGEVGHLAAGIHHQGVGVLEVHLGRVLTEVAHLGQVFAVLEAVGAASAVQIVVAEQARHRVGRRAQAVVHLRADVLGLGVLGVADEGGDADQVH